VKGSKTHPLTGSISKRVTGIRARDIMADRPMSVGLFGLNKGFAVSTGK